MAASILLVTDGIVHPSLSARFWLHRQLEALSGYRFTHARSLAALVDRPAGEFQAIVLYVHHSRLPEGALGALRDFVTSGGGLLGLHSAAASYKNESDYFALLGGRFRQHGPVQRYTVRPDDRPAAPGEPSFAAGEPFQVRDELYEMEWAADTRVHFWAEAGGLRQPYVWTRRAGAGRVCYCAGGHTTGSVRHPSVQAILRDGLGWVSGQNPASGQSPAVGQNPASGQSPAVESAG